MDFYGSIDYLSGEDGGDNREENFQSAKHVLAFFRWDCLSDGDYGRFLCSFATEEESKEYAICYANANSHIVGNRNTLITHLDRKEDLKRRVERYEAYQAYRKYYKEILEAVVNFDDWPDSSSGGGPFLMEAILEAVPQLTERQLYYFWPFVTFSG